MPESVPPVLKRAIELAGARVLRPFGYELRETILNEKPEGFPSYLAQAERAGMDVNTWEEQVLGWVPSEEILRATAFPLLQADARVVELGPGTGRFSRQLLSRIPAGELHLVDHSAWMVRFLERYFAAEPRVRVHLGDGQSLPLAEDGWADMAFAAGTLIALKLGQVHLYAREFARVLKPGGYAIFDYLDPETAQGWAHLEREAERLGHVYTYHAGAVVDRVLQAAGFSSIERREVERSTYVLARR